MKPLSVSELVAQIRHLVEGVEMWQKVWILGELSGVKHHSSGHWYFTIKDESAQMRAVMFRRDAQTLTAPLQDGMAVRVLARVGVFERDGQTQLYVSVVQDIGRGSQELALEQLKQRLYEEGLFSRPKRRLPIVPRAVAIVTSPTGAARYDIETVVNRRFPAMRMVLYPVLVQGKEAARSIVEALSRVDTETMDVLIIGRGGGAKEDLSVFNDESVVRALAGISIPVISAVGHEIDTTLVDLVADLRAPTPSAAAELAVPERTQLQNWQENLSHRADHALMQRLHIERERLSRWTEHGLLAHPEAVFREYRHQLDRIEERGERAFERYLLGARQSVDRMLTSLPLLNPEAPLIRGYAYVTDENDQLVTGNEVQWGQAYRVHWHQRSIWMTRVDHKKENQDE